MEYSAIYEMVFCLFTLVFKGWFTLFESWHLTLRWSSRVVISYAAGMWRKAGLAVVRPGAGAGTQRGGVGGFWFSFMAELGLNHWAGGILSLLLCPSGSLLFFLFPNLDSTQVVSELTANPFILDAFLFLKSPLCTLHLPKCKQWF